MVLIANQCFDEERALFEGRDLHVLDCTFAGEADGESALKESRGVLAERCRFALRYPFWHNARLTVSECEMTETCRAPLWYCEGVHIARSRINGTKALRECRDVHFDGCEIRSDEFGWFCSDVELRDTRAQGAYFLLHGSRAELSDVSFCGKYSFQYLDGGTLTNCTLDTKDAFWHSKNVTVTDCVLRGEYIGWYSENLTLVRCKISGTQPFCYCKNLKLIDCELTEADLAFEKSEVEATLLTSVESIKNPRAGTIRVPRADEIILDDPLARGVILQEG